MVLPYLLSGITFGFAAAVQPGPLQTFFVSRTLTSGWRKTWPAAFAPICSDAPIAFLAVLVLSRIPGGLIFVLQLAGGVFLLYLGWNAYRNWRSNAQEMESKPVSRSRSLMEATVINLLNPNPYLGWSLVMGPLFIRGWRESGANGAALLIGFYGTMVVVSLSIIGLVAGTGRLGNRVNHWLIGLSALALTGFGLVEIWLGIRHFMWTS